MKIIGRLLVILGIAWIAVSGVMCEGWNEKLPFSKNIRSSRIYIIDARHSPLSIIDPVKYEQVISVATAEANNLTLDSEIATNTIYFYSRFFEPKNDSEKLEKRKSMYIEQALKEAGVVKRPHSFSIRPIDALLFGIITTSIGIGLLWVPMRQ